MPHAKPLPTSVIVSRYREGESPEALATAFGVSRKTISRRLATEGVASKPKGPYTTQVVGADGLRPCSRCNRRKPPQAFHRSKSRPDGLQAWCSKCSAASQAEYQLMRRFGITLATFRNLLKQQGGGCAICGCKLGMSRLGRRLRLCVDHCHRTGAVRGILCNSCNNGLGRFRDDPAMLERAADYLRK